MESHVDSEVTKPMHGPKIVFAFGGKSASQKAPLLYIGNRVGASGSDGGNADNAHLPAKGCQAFT